MVSAMIVGIEPSQSECQRRSRVVRVVDQDLVGRNIGNARRVQLPVETHHTALVARPEQ